MNKGRGRVYKRSFLDPGKALAIYSWKLISHVRIFYAVSETVISHFPTALSIIGAASPQVQTKRWVRLSSQPATIYHEPLQHGTIELNGKVSSTEEVSFMYTATNVRGVYTFDEMTFFRRQIDLNLNVLYSHEYNLLANDDLPHCDKCPQNTM